MDETQQRKIVPGTEGVGTVTTEMIEERAREIARADGREETTDLDRTRARKDLSGGSEPSPTVGEPEPDWYTPRGSSREKVPTVRPEDEENMPEKLIQEGVEEADRDQRPKSGRISKG
jgi:hypothetical protein